MTSLQKTSTPENGTARRALTLAIVLLALPVTGCQEHIETTYGHRSGFIGGESVNGTAVLAEMFEQAGHRVRTKRYLTNKVMSQTEVIVWFPDDFKPPTQEVTDWLDGWLSQGGRTLIYVGRDFDAAPPYYDKVIPGATPGDAAELKRRRATARADYAADRAGVTGQPDCDWFLLDTTAKQKSVTSLDGPWSAGVDASKVEIELRHRLEPYEFVPQYMHVDTDGTIDTWEYEEPSGYEWEYAVDAEEVSDESAADRSPLPRDDRDVLLRSGDEILISRQRYDANTDSHLILIQNGSLLLNLPLVNPEHRKIASRLVGEFDDAPRRVAFLESGPGGPEIRPDEPSANVPSGLELFVQRPTDVLLFHLALLGFVFCLSRWPIFGRQRRPARISVSDFGRHVDALGELLHQTGDRGFATSRLRQYQQQRAENE